MLKINPADFVPPELFILLATDRIVWEAGRGDPLTLSAAFEGAMNELQRWQAAKAGH